MNSIEYQCERLNLSRSDLGELAIHFATTIGGYPDDFLEWLTELDDEAAHNIIFN